MGVIQFCSIIKRERAAETESIMHSASLSFNYPSVNSLGRMGLPNKRVTTLDKLNYFKSLLTKLQELISWPGRRDSISLIRETN